jgi:hypothetical protein
MKDKILALLTAAFSGVRKDGLNHLAGALALQVTTEEEANTVVGKLTADRVNQFVTDWRREADAEVTRANKTHEDGLKKKFDFVEKKPDKPVETPANVPEGALDAAAIQKIVTEAVNAATKPVMEEVATLKGSATGAQRRGLLEKELANIPEGYRGKVLKDFDRMTFKDEDSFNEYLSDTKKDVATLTQELADKGLSGFGKPLFGTVDTDGVSAGVQNYIKEKSDSKTVLTGKEV